jgi:LmbE family N-acetylglucosaminyl deacetylase
MMPATVGQLTVVTGTPDRAMVVFAHPDDAEIGSGGVIARWASAGCEVTYVLCTSGNSGTADRSLSPTELARRRADEQRAAADSLGVKHVVMLGYPDGGLEDTRDFRGDIVRALRKYRPHTVFTHDPYRLKSFQHRDHRVTGTATMDAVYPFARDHLHFAEQITQEGLEPHKVRELWFWGADEPNVLVDITSTIDRQVRALERHESQVPGLSVEPGQSLEERVKKRSAELAKGYGFEYGEAFRRIIARR